MSREVAGPERTLAAYPVSRHKVFPTVISADSELPAWPEVDAVVRTAFADGEAEAFAAGHCFTIRADAVADCTIWADSVAQEIASTLRGNGS